MNDLETYRLIKAYSDNDLENKLNNIEGKFDIVSCYAVTISTSIIHFIIIRLHNYLGEAPPLPEPHERDFTA